MPNTPITNTSVDTGFNLKELTEGTLTGTGVFDVLLQTLRAHLDREFKDNRITGTAYATVYSQAITAFLGHAVQFTLSKTKLALELQQMQEQVVLIQKQQEQLIAEIRQKNYITDFQLPVETLLKEKQVALTNYDLTVIKPQELALLQEQVSTSNYVRLNKLPVEIQDIEAGIETKYAQQQQIEVESQKAIYQLNNILPAELLTIRLQQDQLNAQLNKLATETAAIVKQGHLTDAQTCEVQAQTNRLNAETSLKLPEEILLIKKNQETIQADTAQKISQKAQIDYVTANEIPAKVSQVNAQTNLLNYDLNSIKPVELSNLTLTGLGLTAQNSNTTQQTVNLVKQGTVIDSQKVLTDKQALETVAKTNDIIYSTNFVRPEEVKVIKFNQDKVVIDTTKTSAEIINISKQAKVLDAQTCQIEAETNQINAVVGLKLPEEVELIKRNQTQITSQISRIDYEVGYLLPSQVNQTDAQKAQIIYTTSTVLPSQVATNNSQTALYNQKVITEQAQATNAPNPNSAMGIQNLLMQRQADNYLRDAEQKAAKIMTETWQVRANAEPNTEANVASADNRLSNENIAQVIDKLKLGILGTP